MFKTNSRTPDRVLTMDPSEVSRCETRLLYLCGPVVRVVEATKGSETEAMITTWTAGTVVFLL